MTKLCIKEVTYTMCQLTHVTIYIFRSCHVIHKMNIAVSCIHSKPQIWKDLTSSNIYSLILSVDVEIKKICLESFLIIWVPNWIVLNNNPNSEIASLMQFVLYVRLKNRILHIKSLYEITALDFKFKTTHLLKYFPVLIPLLENYPIVSLSCPRPKKNSK